MSASSLQLRATEMLEAASVGECLAPTLAATIAWLERLDAAAASGRKENSGRAPAGGSGDTAARAWPALKSALSHLRRAQLAPVAAIDALEADARRLCGGAAATPAVTAASTEANAYIAALRSLGSEALQPTAGGGLARRASASSKSST